MSEIPNIWLLCRFDEVAKVISGKNQKEVESPTGTYPIYGSGGTFGRATSYLCEPGTTIIGRKGTINSPIFVNEHFWNVDTAFGLFPLNTGLLTEKLLYYFCKLFDFKSLDKSTTIPSLAKRDIEAISIPLPPLAEQYRIVAKIEELFSELDAGEASLRRARQQLCTYRQSLLKQAFEGKLTEQWRKRHPELLDSSEQLFNRIQSVRQAHYQRRLDEWEITVKTWEKSDKKKNRPSKPRELKKIRDLDKEVESVLADLPREWFWASLGLMTLGVEYGTAAKSQKEGKYPVIRMGNLQNGEIDWSDLVFTSDSKEIAQYEMHVGDVLFNRTNSPELVGKTAIYRGTRPAVFAGYLIRVNQIPSVIDSGFLNHFLNSETAKQYGNTVKTDGVNQSNINGEKLCGYPFPFCSLPEQQEIVRILDEQFTVIAQNEQEIDAALTRSTALRQSILKKAFTGQLVPQDVNDEPAAVLLERIKNEQITSKTTSASRAKVKTTHKPDKKL